jgi:hypothetical protein
MRHARTQKSNRVAWECENGMNERACVAGPETASGSAGADRSQRHCTSFLHQTIQVSEELPTCMDAPIEITSVNLTNSHY